MKQEYTLIIKNVEHGFLLRRAKKCIMYKLPSGGGSYNYQGQKDGKWIELSDRYYNFSQVTSVGEYRNGNKVGNWEYYLNYENNKLL